MARQTNFTPNPPNPPSPRRKTHTRRLSPPHPLPDTDAPTINKHETLQQGGWLSAWDDGVDPDIARFIRNFGHVGWEFVMRPVREDGEEEESQGSQGRELERWDGEESEEEEEEWEGFSDEEEISQGNELERRSGDGAVHSYQEILAADAAAKAAAADASMPGEGTGSSAAGTKRKAADDEPSTSAKKVRFEVDVDDSDGSSVLSPAPSSLSSPSPSPPRSTSQFPPVSTLFKTAEHELSDFDGPSQSLFREAVEGQLGEMFVRQARADYRVFWVQGLVRLDDGEEEGEEGE